MICRLKGVRNMGLQFSNLRLYRTQSGLTQEELAEKLGVSRQAVAKWERGESMPDIECCVKLAELYGITVDMLLRNMQAAFQSGLDDDEHKHIFGVTKLNDKGQITLPAECRRTFGLKTGDTLLVLGDEAKGIAIVNLGSTPFAPSDDN